MIALLEAIVKPLIAFVLSDLLGRALWDDGNTRKNIKGWILQGVEPDQRGLLIGAVTGGLFVSYGMALPLGLTGPFEDFVNAESIGFSTPMGTAGWWAGFFVGGVVGARLVAKYLHRGALSWKQAVAFTLTGLRIVFALLLAIVVVYKL